MSIAGVVVVHEPVPELERCLSALKPQLDELVVISNLGLELPTPEGARLIRNEKPVSFAANANRGIAETGSELLNGIVEHTRNLPDFVVAVIGNAPRKISLGVMRRNSGNLADTRRQWSRKHPGAGQSRE